MTHCRSCDYPLPYDRERLGARCPNCRDPLYEAPGRISRPAHQGEGACALHSGSEAVGACGRCGNYYCEICRTRWRDQMLCAACVARALESREETPEQARAHFRQALIGLVLGLSAWAVFLLGLLLGIAAVVAGNNLILFLLVILLFISAMLLAVVGTGHAVAAVRTRGQHTIMAVSGMLIGGLFLGVLLGNYILELWIM